MRNPFLTTILALGLTTGCGDETEKPDEEWVGYEGPADEAGAEDTADAGEEDRPLDTDSEDSADPDGDSGTDADEDDEDSADPDGESVTDGADTSESDTDGDEDSDDDDAEDTDDAAADDDAEDTDDDDDDSDDDDTDDADDDDDDSDDEDVDDDDDDSDGEDTDDEVFVDPVTTDDDGDGFTELEGDCDDTVTAIGPYSTDIVGDGVDQNCDGVASLASGGTDCDDFDDSVYPGAPDVPLDGIDSSCSGAETDPADEPTDSDTATDDAGDSDTGGAEEDTGDTGTLSEEEEEDESLPALSDYTDDDGDGFTEAEGDCDDTVIVISPLATDVVGDGIDQNCDGVDGTDTDGDGFASEASGGTDCDDTDSVINPAFGVADYPDGVDSNCDGTDGLSHDYAATTIVVSSPNRVRVVGDIDGDGLLEVGVTYWDSSIAHIFSGADIMAGRALSTDDAFITIEDPVTGFSGGIAGGDITGDGHAELVLMATSYSETAGPCENGMFYLFDGAALADGGTFVATSASMARVRGDAGENLMDDYVDLSHDVDGDGYADLALHGYGCGGSPRVNGAFNIFLGSSLRMASGLTNTSAYSRLRVTYESGSVYEIFGRVGRDIDLDGMPDISFRYARTSGGVSYTCVLSSAGLGTHAVSTSPPFGCLSYTQSVSNKVHWLGDVDGDGWEDIELSSSIVPLGLLGSGTFHYDEDAEAHVSSLWVDKPIDLNGDGINDLVWNRRSITFGRLGLFDGWDRSEYVDADVQFPPEIYSDFHDAADINNDGKDEILHVEESGFVYNIYVMGVHR